MHCGLHPSLCGTLVLVAMVAVAMMAMATQAVALLRWGDAMVMCDGDKARRYAAHNARAGAIAKQFACT